MAKPRRARATTSTSSSGSCAWSRRTRAARRATYRRNAREGATMAEKEEQGGTVVRPATPADAPAIAAVIARVAEEPQPVGFRRALSAEEVEQWRRRLSDQGTLIVAERDGAVVGFGALDFNT